MTCRKASEDDNRQGSKILIAMLLLSVAWTPGRARYSPSVDAPRKQFSAKTKIWTSVAVTLTSYNMVCII